MARNRRVREFVYELRKDFNTGNADGFQDYQQLKAQGRLPLRARGTIDVPGGPGIGVTYVQERIDAATTRLAVLEAVAA
mgnify:CR=1 FL=1